MTAGATGGAAGGAAAAAAQAHARRVTGMVVHLEPNDFLRLVEGQPAPLVVTAMSGWLRRQHRYLTSYKGLAFHTRSSWPLELPASAEVLRARRMWIP